MQTQQISSKSTQQKKSKSKEKKVELNLSLHHRQSLAFTTRATELLFGGASSGGKSHFVRVALIAWCSQIPGLQCFIFRKHYDDVIGNHMNGSTGFRAMLADARENNIVQMTENEIRFYNGSLIELKHFGDERDKDKRQGRDTHVLVIDEATQIEEQFIRWLRGWVRMPKEFKQTIPENIRDCFPRIIYTANPVGISVGYFRRQFVKPHPPLTLWRAEKEEGGFLRQYIPSRVEDNPSEDREAMEARLSGMGDKAITEAMLTGNWDAPVGDFFPEWSDERHVIPDHRLPSHWFRFRTFDWGTADPFCVHWWAVSDGESYDNGRWIPKDALVCYKEWYGCDENNPAQGNRMRNEDIAFGIKDLSFEYPDVGTVTDSLPFQDRGGKTIAETFFDCGVPLIKGDTSRIPGWSQLRSRLIGRKIDSNDREPTPMIYFMRSCSRAIEYIPALPRHKTKPEDAAESGEATHAADSVRLACMTRALSNQIDKPPIDTKYLTNHITFNDALDKIKSYKLKINGSDY